jgi:putative SbcD/Mre11-related phosphoesterase
MPMEILKGIEIIDSSLWLIKEKVLIIADLHIGYEEALNKQGVLITRNQFKETIELLNKILGIVKPKTIIINGDLKHEFGNISSQEWRETTKILQLLSDKAQVILIKGNHDTILGPIARKGGLEIVDSYCVGDICIIHGDKVLNNEKTQKAKTLIIGHEHPAISLREETKTEKYKCFLLGKWRKQNLIVMPSFLPIIEGSDILKEDILSPYLKQNISNFKIFILGDKVYDFGKLKDLK